MYGIRKIKGRGSRGGAEGAEDIQAFNDHRIGALEGPWKGLRECCRRCREVWG